jgi:DNA-binding NtrC family response regulator
MTTDPDAGKHVLIVEDDSSFRLVVARMLEVAGFRVTATENFSAAIEVIEGDDRIDLLLTDIRMPAGTPNGVTIGRMTQLRRHRLPIIYMTGAYDPRTLSALVPETTVLMKPFSGAELVRAVDAVLSPVGR